MTAPEDAAITHRRLLFTIAYEMLGSAAAAEDIVQETWISWNALGEIRRAAVHDPRAYLVRTVSRAALDHIRATARRREEYVGEWLPEPVLTTPDIAGDVELAESVSYAMLTVLETLTPTERAVFVLHEVFAMPFDEIAAAVGKTSAAVRQIGHRARSHIAARRPRIGVDPTDRDQVVARFLAAAAGGDLQALLDALAPDVVLVADGGGSASAVRRPVRGVDHVGSLLRAFLRLDAGAQIKPVPLNGALGALVAAGRDGADTALTFVVTGGQISRIYAIRNPQKLTCLAGPTALER